MVVLFIVLEVMAISYYAHSTYYTQARLLTRSNQIVGGVHEMFAGIHHYFSLKRENRSLLDYVGRLEERLSKYEQADNAARLDSYLQDVGTSQYRIAAASVIVNSINRPQNLIVVNRGRKDGIVEHMSLLSADGAMAGFVIDCTDRYAVAMSVLNTSFRASGKLADSDYFGSIYWDGTDPHTVILDELSKYAEPQPGQEVVTTGFSEHFPADVLIGWVESAELNPTKTAYKVRVRLAAEMSQLSDVILVENRDRQEIRDLQESEKVEQSIRVN